MIEPIVSRFERLFFMPDEPAASGAEQTPNPAHDGGEAAPTATEISGGSNAEHAAQHLLRKAQEELAAAKTELQKIKDAELSEVDRLKKHAADLEERFRSSERESLRRKVAQEENVPVEGLEYLSGEDENTIRQSAQKLVTLIGSRSAAAAAGSRTQPGGSQVPTIDEQISAAERSGNRALSISLKSQKMRGS